MESFENKLQLGNGIYTVTDIARILRLSYSKASLWLNTYWEGELGKYYSHNYSWKTGNSKAIGFHTLVEMYVMSQLIEAGVKPKDIIYVHKDLSQAFNTLFPFAQKEVLDSLKTDGNKIYFSSKGNTVTLDGTEQLNFEFLLDFFKKLDFDSNQMASKIWPLGKRHKIVCDPHHKFGQPVIEGTNIQAEVVYRMHLAKEPLAYIANLYEITVTKVKDAITFYKDAA